MFLLLKEIGKALAAFCATEVDDYLWLLILFARTQTNPEEYKVKYVCIGQICAFTLIYIISLIGIIFGLFINDKYLGVIGFIPILIGLNLLREQLIEHSTWAAFWCGCGCSCFNRNNVGEDGRHFEKLPINDDTDTDTESCYNPPSIISELDDEDDHQKRITPSHEEKERVGHEEKKNEKNHEGVVEYHHFHSHSPHQHQHQHSKNSSSPGDEELPDNDKLINEEYDHDLEESPIARRINSLFSHIFHYQALQAFVITLMNSGDNIAIYIPLFATASPTALIVCFVTFYVCVGLLLLAAYHTARFKQVADVFENYGHWLVPILLIGLGIFIVAESGLFGGGFKV